MSLPQRISNLHIKISWNDCFCNSTWYPFCTFPKIAREHRLILCELWLVIQVMLENLNFMPGGLKSKSTELESDSRFSIH